MEKNQIEKTIENLEHKISMMQDQFHQQIDFPHQPDE